MTITPTAPTITPCPVDWCPSAGHHQWDDSPSGEAYRFHRVERRCPSAGVTVAHDVLEERNDAELDIAVWVTTGSVDDVLVMRSRDAVDELVFALEDAADAAFPEPPLEPCITQEDMDEFDAATAELVERAGRPTDVNRLVAAAVRFRNAYLGA